MKTIQIENEIYDHLLRNTSYLGEDASSILRRLLRISSQSPREAPAMQPAASLVRSSVDDLLGGSRLQIERDAVQRFLVILSWVHDQHPTEFSSVLRIEGRSRLYFAKDAETLRNSGASVFPQQIPNTEYWVVTNNDTPKKKRILEDVLRMLRYSPGEIIALKNAVG